MGFRLLKCQNSNKLEVINYKKFVFGIILSLDAI